MTDLDKLKLDLAGMNESQKRDLGWDWYSKQYLTNPEKAIGIHVLHDGDKVIFHGRTFDHAFYKSSNYELHPKRKDLIDDTRIERVRWIAPLMAGLVPNSACWEVVALSGRPGIPNRVYLAHSQSYVVWFEPRPEGDPILWKFMSAYVTSPQYIKTRIQIGTRIWRHGTGK